MGGGSDDIDVIESAGRGTLAGVAGIEVPDGNPGRSHRAIFRGLRILLVGFSDHCKDELTKQITQRGGSVLTPTKHDMCTHICVEGEVANSGKKIITKEWIKKCCDCNAKLDLSNDLPDCEKPAATCEAVKKSQGITHASSQESLIKFSFEEKEMVLHEFIVCKADSSWKLSVPEFIAELGRLTARHITPGTFGHESVSAVPEVKGIIRQMYLKLKALHRLGYSLYGQFTLGNFVLLESTLRNIKFALPLDNVQKASPHGVKLDDDQLVRMIRREVFSKPRDPTPHGISMWLNLVGRSDIADLLPHHVSLLSDELCSSEFDSWCDIYKDLKGSQAHKDLLKHLKEYKGWKKAIECPKHGNALLAETLKWPGSRYDNDNVNELMKLFRNSRQHVARYRHGQFSQIVGSIFPNLISDLQIGLFKAGRFKNRIPYF